MRWDELKANDVLVWPAEEGGVYLVLEPMKLTFLCAHPQETIKLIALETGKVLDHDPRGWEDLPDAVEVWQA